MPYKGTLKQREQFRKWKEAHPGYMEEYQRKWRQANPTYQKDRRQRLYGHGDQLYCIRNTETGRLKIGKGEPLRRFKGIQGAHDCVLELVLHKEVNGPFQHETKLKSLLEPFHVRGEWYTAEAWPLIEQFMNSLPPYLTTAELVSLPTTDSITLAP